MAQCKRNDVQCSWVRCMFSESKDIKSDRKLSLPSATDEENILKLLPTVRKIKPKYLQLSDRPSVFEKDKSEASRQQPVSSSRGSRSRISRLDSRRRAVDRGRGFAGSVAARSHTYLITYLSPVCAGCGTAREIPQQRRRASSPGRQ